MTGSVEIFDEVSINNITSAHRWNVNQTIENEDDSYILEVGEADYIDYLIEEHKIEDLKIHFQDPAPSIEREKNGRKTEYHIYYKVSGNAKLLKAKPEGSNGWSDTAYFEKDDLESISEFWVAIPVNELDAEEIQARIDETKTNIRENYEVLSDEIEEFNHQLEDVAREEFRETKKRYQKELDILDEVDISVRERPDRPDKVAVPSPERKEPITVEKPSTHDDSANLVPTLSKEDYLEILKAIYDIGTGFERSPALFEEKGEEDIRDFILFYLQMNFVGEATGETFNNRGKTDILLRYEGDNVFIGECAIWAGQKYFVEKIDQLNKYLTYRDTKCAVILFNFNKSMTGVQRQIEAGAENHPQFVESLGKKGDSWYQYRFHFPDDEEREIDLAVQCYHLR